ncbi:hypothetical protein G6F40_002640 [Rhizopus arrhizus]|nr:hypothetical protein G6F40_002640 [Rhizopus arrhizus]
MGQLLSSLNLRGNSDIVPEIGFDIENAAPTTEESEIHDELYTLLIQPTTELLQSFRQYEPASDMIREAIASPTTENEDKAWEAVTPTVNMLRTFYSYSSQLEKGIPTLLNVLCKDGTTKDLDRHPGLTKLFADLLDFVFEFDYIKIRSPAIQNDFSFYRRTLQRGRSLEDSDPAKSNLRTAMDEDDLANRISLFIAYSTPMLKCLIDTTVKYVQSNQSTKSVSEWLSSIWAMCYQTLSKKKSNDSISSFCFKVMVVTIILYDHVDPQGAFSKYSPINVKNSLKIISSHNNTQQDQSSTGNLISALRYNSKHLNDESTPKAIKNIIMAT